jgi:lipopolysaccharide/colanic/teichoic acid biosynthesis glycosyltransferase
MALPILLPMAMIIACMVYVYLGSPVLFRQLRPGLNGRPFALVKFRTMQDIYDEKGKLLPDEMRLTRLGLWLRRTSLDELPEFWNVLNGDMSLVGPRPLLMEYLPLYSPEQARRHELKPGITGWAQVNGRNAISWEEKFMLDIWYVEHWSLLLDFRILALTVLRVLHARDINQPGSATVSKFTGRETR